MLSSSPGVAPNGAALIASMATEMYNFWIDTEDDPVKLPVVIRRQPFPNFKWTMTPKLRHRAVLRPVQAGIINVYMWAHAMRQPTWPGHIHCSIWEHDGPVKYGLELGSLDIENFADVPSPSADKKLEAGAAADKAQANSSSNTAVSPIPVEFETRWLQCFAQFWFGKIIHQWYAENVGEEWPIGPTGILERSYDCGTASHADKFTIRLYPDSGVYSPHPMTWDALAKGMMDWINQVALKEHNPYNLPYYIVDSSGTYAMLDIELQTPSKGTATA
ncbi:MAG: hypothetical protein L6R40_007863 [Gallowayella cf. fulva]|nr:MAG: hypothetical protein L6R40_007863 [Xanthomendoza cf. fulva]